MITAVLTQKIQKGFTLVELLVVIAILGILAATLLATLDPIEQINKSRDSAAKSAAHEYGAAIQRYYASHGYYPWDASATSPCGTAGNPPANASNPATAGCITQLTADGELKSSFTFPATNTFAWNFTAPNTVNLCYLPKSKSGLKDKDTRFTNAMGACTTSTGVCYACITQ